MLFDHRLIFSFKTHADARGISHSLRQFFNSIGITSITVTGTVPNQGPTLIISNHPGVFDSLLLVSHITRLDYYFTALATYRVLGTQIASRLLPIYRRSRLNHRIYEYPFCLETMGSFPEKLSTREIQSRNRQTICDAAQTINQGGAVSIFPTGSGGKSLPGSSWKPGVGFLIKQITNPRTKLVFTDIQGTRKTDLVAFLHPSLRKLFFHPQPITVAFAKPVTLQTIVDQSASGKQVTRQVENLYTHHFAPQSD